MNTEPPQTAHEVLSELVDELEARKLWMIMLSEIFSGKDPGTSSIYKLEADAIERCIDEVVRPKLESLEKRK